jgi:hypothetical protein
MVFRSYDMGDTGIMAASERIGVVKTYDSIHNLSTAILDNGRW